MNATYCPQVVRVESAEVTSAASRGGPAKTPLETLAGYAPALAIAGGVRADGLLDALATVPDPRNRHGVRYPLACVLVLCLAAVLSGEKTIADIVAYAAAAPRWLLTAAGVPVRRGRLRAPHADTVERVLAKVDGQAADDAIGGWFARRSGLGVIEPDAEPAEPTVEEETGVPLPVLLVDGEIAAVGVDGKAMAGALDAGGRPRFLLAAVTHTLTSVLAQRRIGPKSNEIPQVAPLLAPLDLAGVVVTMDSLHTQRGHARFLVEDKRAHFVFIVKDNQPKLFDALDGLDWRDVEVEHHSDERGHGRHEIRTLRRMRAPNGLGVLFPHVQQVFLVERYTKRTIRCRRRGSGRFYTKVIKTAVAVLGITSLMMDQVTAEQLAALVRGHWAIEALHHVRDVTFREDASTVSRGDRPRLMATLRNTSIGLIRQSGTKKIAATIRKLKHDPHRLLTVLGLEIPQELAPDLG